eukprot:2936308-Prorocentrum_lima.AAC.1
MGGLHSRSPGGRPRMSPRCGGGAAGWRPAWAMAAGPSRWSRHTSRTVGAASDPAAGAMAG